MAGFEQDVPKVPRVRTLTQNTRKRSGRPIGPVTTHQSHHITVHHGNKENQLALSANSTSKHQPLLRVCPLSVRPLHPPGPVQVGSENRPNGTSRLAADTMQQEAGGERRGGIARLLVSPYLWGPKSQRNRKLAAEAMQTPGQGICRERGTPSDNLPCLQPDPDLLAACLHQAEVIHGNPDLIF